MAVKDFNQDGAAGAYGGNGGTANSAGTGEPPLTAPGTPNSPNSPSLPSGVEIAPGNAGAYQQAMRTAPGSAPTGNQIAPGGWAARMQATDPMTRLAFQQGNYSMAMADGGAIPDDQDDSDPSAQGNPDQTSNDIVGQALAAVDQTLQYGRQKYGLSGGGSGGGQQTAGAIPIAPGTQSDSGSRPLPAPGPLPPTSNPFGRRQGQPFGRVAGNIPAVPGSQSDSGVVQLPGPGTLAPTANPFGKRLVRPPQPSGPAIPDDQES